MCHDSRPRRRHYIFSPQARWPPTTTTNRWRAPPVIHILYSCTNGDAADLISAFILIETSVPLGLWTTRQLARALTASWTRIGISSTQSLHQLSKSFVDPPAYYFPNQATCVAGPSCNKSLQSCIKVNLEWEEIRAFHELAPATHSSHFRVECLTRFKRSWRVLQISSIKETYKTLSWSPLRWW